MIDTGIFEVNIKALKKRYPSIADAVIKCSEEPNDYRIAAANDPISKAAGIKSGLRNPAILICLGIDDPSVLVEYLRNPHPAQKVLVIIERSVRKFAAIIERYDLSATFENPMIYWLVNTSENEMDREVTNTFIQPGVFEWSCGINMIKSSWSEEDDEKYYSIFAGMILKKIKDYDDSKHAAPIDGYHGLINVLDNWETFKSIPDLAGLKNLMKGVPGIVVSTGPSLSRRIELIKKHKECAIIYSADSAIRILLAHDIKPHFVGTHERTAELHQFYKGLAGLEDTYFVTNPIIAPQVNKSYEGPKLHLVRAIPVVRWFYPREDYVVSGMCVAHLGIGLLDYLGCNPIVLMGQDLCYDQKRGFTHADGMLLQGQSSDDWNKHEHIWIDGNGGKQVKSTSYWDMFVKWISQKALDSNIKIISVMESDEGAFINHVKLVNPSEFVLPPLDFSVKERLDAAIKKISPCLLDDTILNETRDELNNYAGLAETVVEQIANIYINSIPDFNKGVVPAYIPAFMEKLEKAGEVFVNDINTLFLASFLRYEDFEAQRQSSFLLGAEMDEVVRVKKQFELVFNWFSAIVFWGRMTARAIERKINEQKKNQIPK